MPAGSSGWSDSNWYERVPLASDGGKWREFFSLKKATGRNVMVAFNAGDAAKYPASDTDASLVSQALAALNGMFPSFGSSPSQTWVTRWQDDPWTLGSYSYLKVGAKGTERKTLAAKIKNLLYFAGEHTSTDYPATVQGAYISGQDAASAAANYWA
jgi:monoamine oxidase